jgi:ParB-like chromosome segregation protein Spo0J
MEVQTVSISEIKPNPNNPRVIKDDKFEKLVKSIKEFPKMLEIRPIVVNDDMIVLGGNMRLKACKAAGLKEVPIIKASELNEDEQRQFIIKDNVSGGEWDWDMLANEWDAEELQEWGLDVPNYDSGDIIELDKITTTFNINIKCDSPEELEKMKFKLGITSNSIHSTILEGLLA